MTGSNQKCTNTGNAEHGVTSKQICEDEARANNVRYYSYVDDPKLCFYSSTCSPIITGTSWAWNTYEKNAGNSLHHCEKILDNDYKSS